jgi:hypothetical protein
MKYSNENPVTLVLDQAGESLQGFGTFVGNVDNQAGLVTPGIANLDSAVFSTGTLSISGNYRQGAAGTLAIKLDSTRDGLLHDVLNVSGNVVADGRLRFDLVNGSTALATASLIGQDFRPFNFGSFAGRFDVSTPQGLNLKLNPDGSISIDSENQLLLAISSQITSLIEKRDVRFEDIILNARFVDKIKENLPVQDDDPRKRRFARLVCK